MVYPILEVRQALELSKDNSSVAGIVGGRAVGPRRRPGEPEGVEVHLGIEARTAEPKLCEHPPV